ncbi:MAG: BolA family protein [Pseudomonadota bacterium]
MNAARVELITQILQEAFEPTTLQVIDQSHLHAGHAGAQDGRGHFKVNISSSAFNGKRPIACHQAIYKALGDLMTTDIHALSIKASGTE